MFPGRVDLRPPLQSMRKSRRDHYTFAGTGPQVSDPRRHLSEETGSASLRGKAQVLGMKEGGGWAVSSGRGEGKLPPLTANRQEADRDAGGPLARPTPSPRWQRTFSFFWNVSIQAISRSALPIRLGINLTLSRPVSSSETLRLRADVQCPSALRVRESLGQQTWNMRAPSKYRGQRQSSRLLLPGCQ